MITIDEWITQAKDDPRLKYWAGIVDRPPSLYKTYVVAGRQMVYSSTARQYMARAWEQLKAFPMSVPFDRNDPLFMRITYFRSDVETKNGKYRFSRWDLPNQSKILIDVTMRFLGTDDSQIVGLASWKKVAEKGDDHVLIEVCLSPPEIWKE